MRPEWRIWKKVQKLCYLDGIGDGGSVQLYSELGFEEYFRSIDSGKSPRQAYKVAIASAESEMERRAGWSWIKARYGNFSIIASLIMFIYSFCVMVNGLVRPDAFLFIGASAYPPMFFVIGFILIYALVTFKRRTFFDFSVVFALLITTLVVIWECFWFFYRGDTGRRDYTAQYIFPGLIKFFSRYRREPYPSEAFDIYLECYLFDPTLLVTFLCLLSALTLKIRYCLRRNKKCA